MGSALTYKGRIRVQLPKSNKVSSIDPLYAITQGLILPCEQEGYNKPSFSLPPLGRVYYYRAVIFGSNLPKN